jgi:thymidylate synthase (FAD)
MKKRYLSMVTASVGLTTFLIWVATLPLLIVLGYLLAIKKLNLISEIVNLYVISFTLEHCVVTYKFTVPLYIRSQHHRHRTWSYNEISRRYTEKNLEFYCPREFRTQHKSNRQASNIEEMIDPLLWHEEGTQVVRAFHPPASEIYREHCLHSLRLFEELVNKGVCREQARGVLPQTLYTEYYGTVNLGNLLKFVSLRMHEGAQHEIQKVAEACLEIAADLFPVTVKSYRASVNNGKV